MTVEQTALILTACGTLLSSIVAAIGVVFSVRNSRKLDVNNDKIDAVHRSTNGLAERNEAIARKLGVVEGIQQGTAREKQRAEDEHK